MKGLRKKLEDLMNAVTFAEANEHETARTFIGGAAARKKRVSLDDIMTAITFAEAGLPDTAREFLGVGGPMPKPACLKLPGVKVWYGSFSEEENLLPGVKIWFGVAPVNA